MAATIDDIAAIVHFLLDCEASADSLRNELKTVEETIRRTREETIPSIMQEAGISELTLATGQKLKIRQEVYASLSQDRKAEAFAWLEQNGFGGIIKTDIKISYGRGDYEEAKTAFNELKQQHNNVVLDENIHPQTLKAFLREQIAAGANVPLALFNAQPVWSAKISER